MDWIILTEALFIGLTGSIHCIGMCGPLALALPIKKTGLVQRFLSSFIYNTGRVITYGILGIIAGMLGNKIASAGLQQWVSIGLGSIMILSVILPFLFRSLQLGSFYSRVTAFIPKTLGRLMGSGSFYNLAIIGLLNGLLPCGLVYIALAGAVQQTHAVQGILYMVAFGFGTFATMLFIPVIGRLISQVLRKQLRFVVPVVIILLGILFILRGMNLGIKFVSPKIDKAQQEMKCPHHTGE